MVNSIKQWLRSLLPVSGKDCFVYLIGDEGAILLYIEEGAVARRIFAPIPEQEYTASFLSLLKEHPDVPIYVLVDVMDQSYVRHAIPPVPSWSVNKLIQRRLERDFAPQDLKGFLSLGKEKEGRKDWNLLLISLTYSKELEAWLNLVYELPNQFMGVYLVPAEAEILLTKIHKLTLEQQEKEEKNTAASGDDEEAKNIETDKKAGAAKLGKFGIKLKGKKKGKEKQKKTKEKTEEDEWQILVSHNKVGGFRQVVLKNGKLIFTRIAQAFDDTNPGVLAGSIEQEVQNTIEYLRRLSYNPNSNLYIYIIIAPEVQAIISDFNIAPNIKIHTYSPYEVAELLKLKKAVLSGDRFGDIVIAASFGTSKKKKLRLDTEYTTQLRKLYSGRTALRMLSILSVLGLIGGIGYAVYDRFNTADEVDRLKKEKIVLQNQLEEAKKLSETLDSNIDRATDFLLIDDKFGKETASPLEVVKNIATLLKENILVRRMDWKLATILNAPQTMPAEEIINFDIELTYDGQQEWEDFINEVTSFRASVNEKFSSYYVEYSELPTRDMGGKGELFVNFEDNNSGKEKENYRREYIMKTKLKTKQMPPP